MVKRAAFTLLEIVFVIVILGIVSSFSADIFSSIYRNYVSTQIVNQLETQTSIALEQISKRLSYRISGSAIARKNDGKDFTSASDPDLNDYEILEWIPYSSESQKIAGDGGWSGFIDLSHTDTNKTDETLFSPGGDLTRAFEYINDLSGKDKALLVFRSPRNAEDFGWKNTDNTIGTNMAIVKNKDQNTFEVTDHSELKLIYEHYQLAHEANAIAPEDSEIVAPDTTITNKDLWLYYNYQPWEKENFVAGKKQLIARNISMFRFREVNHVMHLKLCLHDNKKAGLGEYVVVCKEKVVL